MYCLAATPFFGQGLVPAARRKGRSKLLLTPAMVSQVHFGVQMPPKL